jgi:ankyrin repeat protein
MKKVLMISMAALFVVAPCYGNAFKKAAWVVVPYLKNQALIKAAKKGDVIGVKKAIKAGADVNFLSRNYEAHTALIAAAANGHNDVVEVLIEAGARVNSRVYYGHKISKSSYNPMSESGSYTALEVAIAHGHAAVVKTLLGAGAVEQVA